MNSPDRFAAPFPQPDAVTLHPSICQQVLLAATVTGDASPMSVVCPDGREFQGSRGPQIKRTSSASALPTPPLLSVEAIAERLAVSTKTVRRMIARGELTCCRVGRLLRVSEAALAAYLQQ